MRARNIKPGFFQNDELSDLIPLARILFAGLWCFADREGRFEWKPKKIKALILPYDKCNVMSLLDALAQKNFILRYEIDGNDYGWIPTFLEHQNPHPHEKKSRIPECSENVIKCHDMSLHDIKCKCPVCVSNRDSKKRDSEKGGSGGKEKIEDEKIKYAEFVSLTEDEHRKLIEKYGDRITEQIIEKLNNGKGAKGYTYKSDYHAVFTWVARAVFEDMEKEGADFKGVESEAFKQYQAKKKKKEDGHK